MNARAENTNECECRIAHRERPSPAQYDHHHVLIERDDVNAITQLVMAIIDYGGSALIRSFGPDRMTEER